jgi:hypothetical protein
MTAYVDSNGKSHDIATMPYPFLVNARRKLERTPLLGEDRSAGQQMSALGARDRLVADMRAEEARRNVAYAASVPGADTAELHRALRDMTPERRAADDWTPERQAVLDAVLAELTKRDAGLR